MTDETNLLARNFHIRAVFLLYLPQTRKDRRKPMPPAAFACMQNDYSKCGSQSPWASMRSSHRATILSMGSSLEVWGSSMAA